MDKLQLTRCYQLLTHDDATGVACSPSASVEWSRRDGDVLSSLSSVADFGRRLLLTGVSPADSAQYVCRASNKIGDARATVLLTVDRTLAYSSLYSISSIIRRLFAQQDLQHLGLSRCCETIVDLIFMLLLRRS